MRKHIKTGLIATLLASTIPTANAQDWFVSGLLGATKQDISVKAGGEKATWMDGKAVENKFDNPGLGGIRIGTYLTDNVRTYLNLNIGSLDANQEMTGNLDGEGLVTLKDEYKIDNRELSLSADYVDHLFGLQNTRYFVGGTLGLNQMEVERKFTGHRHADSARFSEKGSKKSTALMYGIQSGIIHNFTDSFSAELGYRYSFLNNEAKFTIDDVAMKVKNKNQQAGYLAVSYHF